uniref:Deoxyguanosinetriphosphate triphosphohydrolase-like protein n=1 Tax=Caldicellulosiruptor owensensis TaxID=55205 RepID=A0A7C5V538_9FIRM
MLKVREYQESLEEKILSPYATLSKNTKGRQRPEQKCDVRTDFQRDRDRIIHSKSFRRLKHKTQVFISPEGDHYRTRLTHALEVAQIARTIARALRLNEDLTEAIALGHDLGHTPFGHAGEDILNKITTTGFSHNVQSLRVVDFLEGEDGLNLTFEVRDGILNHVWGRTPATLEGRVVQFADRIAYINHDIDDAMRAGILKEDDLPRDCLKILGFSKRERINTLIRDIIKNSMDKPEISMSEDVFYAMQTLRSFMFENVYIGSEAKKDESKAKYIIQALYEYFMSNCDVLPGDVKKNIDRFGKEQAIVDYIAGMTDRYAMRKFYELFLPSPWNKL